MKRIFFLAVGVLMAATAAAQINETYQTRIQKLQHLKQLMVNQLLFSTTQIAKMIQMLGRMLLIMIQVGQMQVKLMITSSLKTECALTLSTT